MSWLIQLMQKQIKKNEGEKLFFIVPMRAGKTFLSSLRFASIGGHVVSENSGERQWVSADRVRILYGLPQSKCRLIGSETKEYKNEILLTPRNDGDYDLFKRILEYFND